jgi:hypothetical protein
VCLHMDTFFCLPGASCGGGWLLALAGHVQSHCCDACGLGISHAVVWKGGFKFVSPPACHDTHLSPFGAQVSRLDHHRAYGISCSLRTAARVARVSVIDSGRANGSVQWTRSIVLLPGQIPSRCSLSFQ